MIQPGNIIDNDLKIYRKIGSGGFGNVYLAYSESLEQFIAVKTFKPDLLPSSTAREQFSKEILTWINIDYHPNVVKALTVYKPISTGLYLGLEYIPQNDSGFNTLAQHLNHKTLPLRSILNWSIQFCYGMEHLSQNGIKCHRDIKPLNILINPDNILKITDFGLANFFENQYKENENNKIEIVKHLGNSTITGASFGTPMYMPPEQFEDAKHCDERSDIYSFGVVLYQMLNSGKAPFNIKIDQTFSNESSINYFQKFYQLHKYQDVPKLKTVMSYVVEKCLQKKPQDRYQSFGELRNEIESSYREIVETKIYLPDKKNITGSQLNNKGLALNALGFYDKSIPIFIKAIESGFLNEYVYMNIGITFYELGKYNDALKYFDLSLEINSFNEMCYNNKARCLIKLGRYEEAIKFTDYAISLDKNYANAYNNKGQALMGLKSYDEALTIFQLALNIEPNFTSVFNNIAIVHTKLNNLENAQIYFRKALQIDPLDINGNYNLGKLLFETGDKSVALEHFIKVTQIDKNYVDAWFYQGVIFQELTLAEKAILCFNEVISRKENSFTSWHRLGVCYDNVFNYESAIRCFDRAIAINRTNSIVWFLRAMTLEKMDNKTEAINSYKKFIELEKNIENPNFIDYAQEHINILKNNLN